MARRFELLKEVDRRLVPRRSEPEDASLLAEGVDLLVFTFRELEGCLQITVGGVLKARGPEPLAGLVLKYAAP